MIWLWVCSSTATNLVGSSNRINTFETSSRAEWNEGQSLGVGATFHGWNQAGDNAWDVDCEVCAVEHNKEFAFRAATDLLGENATLWRFVVEPTEGGTNVTESYEAPILAIPDHPVAQIPGRAEALSEGMKETLQNLKATIEGAY